MNGADKVRAGEGEMMNGAEKLRAGEGEMEKTMNRASFWYFVLGFVGILNCAVQYFILFNFDIWATTALLA